MKTALIEYKGKPAGVLKETDEGYEFLYGKEYLSDADSKPVSLTVALRNTDISELDRFSLLLLCCKDCIGAVSVIPIKEDGDE